MVSAVEVGAAVRRWDEDGFVVLPGFLTTGEIAAAVAELPGVSPTADEFHDDVDPLRNARFRSEFGGIEPFPFGGVELSLLAVHTKLIGLAAALLRTTDLRLYSSEAWAKYTGAADYDQQVHRDFLNHTPVFPSDDVRFKQMELFLFLSDVDEAHGPPHYVPRSVSGRRSALPNWQPRDDVPEMYAAQVSAAGTVVVGDAAAARAVRLPATGRPVLDRGDAHRHRRALPRPRPHALVDCAEHDG